MRKTTITALGASLLAISLTPPVLAQQSGHPHQALTSEQKQQQAFPIIGMKMFIEVDSDTTNGTVAVVRSYVPPKSGPPAKVQDREDLLFTIVRGHYRFRYGDKEIDAPPGTSVFLPRKIPHVVRNVSDQPGEHIVTMVPGGLEKMFREISAAKLELPRDIAKLDEISARYGIKNLPPASMVFSNPQQSGHPHQPLGPDQKQQQAFPMAGAKMFVEVDSDQTNGAVAVVRAYVPPKFGPSPHVHSREDEIYTIVRGHYRFRHGTEVIDAPAGTVVFLPRNVPHAFANIGDGPGEHILTLVPGGLEKMFREVAAAQIELPRDLAKFREISAKYGLKFVPRESMPISAGR